MSPLLQAFSLQSSIASHALQQQGEDPSGMATPQLLEHPTNGASQLHSIDVPEQVCRLLLPCMNAHAGSVGTIMQTPTQLMLS